jgi:hypothetical protein
LDQWQNNPGDIVCKYWYYSQIWNMLQAILFYSGYTNDVIKEDEMSLKDHGDKGLKKKQSK